jgi:chromosome partitioning protein
MIRGLVGWLTGRGSVEESGSSAAVLEAPPLRRDGVPHTAIAVMNQKGGCGKTTTAVNLSACLVEQGFRVLLVDIDPQGHSTLGLGVKGETVARSVYHLLMQPEARLRDVLLPTSMERLELAPANIELSSAQIELINVPGREARLRAQLEASDTASAYDFTLIDCPPTLNLLTINALVASDCVLVPVQPHYYSLDGMRELFKTIDVVRERFNARLWVLGILPTMTDRRLKIANEMLSTLREYFKGQMFRTEIHLNAQLMEAPIFGEPACRYAPASRGAKDYAQLAEEVLELVRAKSQY